MKFQFIALILVASASSIAQTLNSQQRQSIDSIFTNWNSRKKPGVAVAVVRNGTEIYSQTFGMADIGSGVKLDNRTPLWIASVSKQFTAIGITVLEQKGLLSVDDQIAKYLPELEHLPPIQIRHLLHHSSGLRDGFTLVGMTLKGEKHYDAKSVFNMITKQRSLNFTPGTRYEYVNSNYVLLALIAERVSKQSFTDFMNSNVFSKIGMPDSRIFNDNATASDAKGHYNSSGHYKKNKRFIPAIGSTGVMMSLRDAVKLEQNLQGNSPFVSLEKLLSEDEIVPPLKSYKRGLEHYQLKGYEIVSHFGSDPGFRADIVRIPSEKISIIIFSNAGDYWDLSKNIFDIAGIVLGNKQLSTKWYSDQEVKSDSAIALKYQGAYLDTISGSITRFIKYENGILRSSPTLHGYYAPLKNESSGTYSKQDNYEFKYMFAENVVAVDRADGVLNLVKVDSSLVRIHSDLSDLKGRYYSAELRKTYRITQKNGSLRLTFLRVMHSPLLSLGNDMYYTEFFGGNIIRFKKGQDDKFSLFFSREGIKDLYFEKR